ncbi:MAG: glycosyl hydrolase [Candidatus Eisenbacteria bacterium]|nr:glycosyl hydrolase [Candidatus Eisenbacteria bacterium]
MTIVLPLVAALLMLAPPPSSAAPAKSAAISPDAYGSRQLAALQWRNIGPFRGGRVTAVAGVVGQRNVYYFGGTGGGVWKSTDSGNDWSNVSDGQLGTGSVGAVSVAPSDPNVVWVGMGEGCIRGNVSHGDGVYRSTDAGRTWTHLGLADTRQIGRIAVDPRDPDVAYVAALGHTFGPNRERGVFRTRDGGVTWKNVLFVNDSTGAIDVSLDPLNPRILYAATWQVYRTPWSLSSGGAGSGLWKSTDAGESWTRLAAEGLPKGVWGRVGVSASGAQAGRVFAVIEADAGGVFRSDDWGRTWRRTNESRDLRQRAWYYTHVFADPKNADVVWVLNVGCMRSRDGGVTFQRVGTPHGDNHDLWLDPADPQRLIEGNDGGACVSNDGGLSWTSLENQPTAQFYRVTTDDAFPYRVYGAQQDNSTVGIASRTAGFGIGRTDWYDVGGGESGWIAPKPGEPGIVYAGSYNGLLTRVDRRSEQERDVNPYPDNPMGWGAEGAKYRFQWSFPIVISPHDPNTVYAASNVLHRSTNEGQSWEVISPDLTRNDPAKLVSSGGPVTQDNTSVEYFCTIFAFAESKLEKGVLWAGSDDGLVHVSRDAGRNWRKVTPPGLPEWATINSIDVGTHASGTAYVAAHRYRLDDFKPYAYVTHDYGRTWRSVAGDLPADGGFVRVVREDPVREGLLYAGTETGLWFSVDEGAHWRPLRVNRPGLIADLAKPDGEARGALPLVPITDLVVKDDALVVATQGRSFWILDDLGPLRQASVKSAAAGAWLFTPTPAYLYGGGGGFGARGNLGGNPPAGATFYYRLAAEPREKQEITLEVLDSDRKLVRKYSNLDDPDADPSGSPGGGEGMPFAFGGARKLPAKAGLNRFTWDLRGAEASRFKGLILWGGGLQGPRVAPGAYQARFTANGQAQVVNFEVRKDPRVAATQADYQSRYDLHARIRDKLTETHDAITRLREVREQIRAVADRAKAAGRDTTVAAAANALTKKLTAAEEALYQTRNKSSQDPLNYPVRLNNKLSQLTDTVDGADAPPTDQAAAVYADVAARIDEQLAVIREALGPGLDAFNKLVRDRELPAVFVREKQGGKPAPPPIP